jgi:hypothetical protein
MPQKIPEPSKDAENRSAVVAVRDELCEIYLVGVKRQGALPGRGLAALSDRRLTRYVRGMEHMAP